MWRTRAKHALPSCNGVIEQLMRLKVAAIDVIDTIRKARLRRLSRMHPS